MLVLAALVSCGIDSPPQQKERLRKAAGVSAFRIVCSRDLWDRTGGKHGRGESLGSIKAAITPRADGLVTVQITGPALVDLLEYLDRDAHGGGWSVGHSNPLSIRMYDAIAPRVDALQTTPKAGTPVPEVVIDDGERSTVPSSPTPSHTN